MGATTPSPRIVQDRSKSSGKETFDVKEGFLLESGHKLDRTVKHESLFLEHSLERACYGYFNSNGSRLHSILVDLRFCQCYRRYQTKSRDKLGFSFWIFSPAFSASLSLF